MKLKKIVAIIFIFVLCINTVFASTLEDKLGDYQIHSYDDPISYVSYNQIRQKSYTYFYFNEEGEEESVYCLNIGLPGAEAFEEGYIVTADEAIRDKTLASVISYAYPYQSLEELGLKTVDEARFASQFAIWSCLNRFNLDLLTPNEPQYQRVIDAIKNIYYNGMSHPYERKVPVQIYETKDNMSIDELDPNYYSKTYSIASNTNLRSLKAKTNISNVLIVNENNEPVTELAGLKTFKILIPVSTVDQDKVVDLTFEAILKENAALFAASKIAGMQSVAITFAPLDIDTLNLSLFVKKLDMKLEIYKVDQNFPDVKIAGAKFKITNITENKELGIFETNEEGKIVLDYVQDLNVVTGSKLRIEEIEVPAPYAIDPENSVQEIEITIGNDYPVVFQNDYIKGKVKIEKVSGFDGKALAGTEFEILDEKGEVVETLVTNDKGIALSGDLKYGKYQLREVKTDSQHKLLEEAIFFEIKQDKEEILIHVTNEYIELPERLPSTGY